MSEPKRYAILGVCVEPSYEAQEVCSQMIAVPNGAWVRYDDYARLKEEVERLNEIIRREVDGGVNIREEAQRTVEENHKFQAEVERFKFTLEEERQITRQDWAGLRCEHDRVKRALEQAEAEVERLKEGNECLNQMHEKEMARSAYLCEQVERLRKAGDAMVDYIERTESNAYDIEADGDDRIAEWNAAKEGKPSV